MIMDLPVDSTKDYIVAFGQLKLIKDRNINDKGKKDSRDTKKTLTCKLPRNVKANSCTRKIKSNGQTNVSGDSVGTSRQIYSPTKLKIDKSGKDDKNKPSLIPRRRTTTEIPIKESFQNSLVEPNNIQRVQLVNINTDFCPEVKSPPKSVASAKPIPTLGHIYRQELSNDTFTDWYLETVGEYLDVPEDSIDCNATLNTSLQIRSNCITGNNEEPVINGSNNVSNGVSCVKNSGLLNNKAPFKLFTNESVSKWLSSELDQTSKDDESGYRSMSPPSKGIISTKANNSNILKVPHYEDITTISDAAKKSVSTTAIYKYNISGFLLDEQATVFVNKGMADSIKAQHNFNIPKMNTDIKPLTNLRADIHKPLKYPSTPNADCKRENIQILTASYVEYPSEVFQRTTNFETDASGILSNVIIDAEDKKSGQLTLDTVDEYSVPIDDVDWSRLPSSQDSALMKSSNTSYLTEESWRDNCTYIKNETNKTKCSDKYSYHDYYNHYCWRKEVVKKSNDECPWDYKGTCKKCHRYRQSPKKNNFQRPFLSLKSRHWIGRNCKYGWSRVWKKTAERWANWSKSPSRFGKSRMMNYLQKSLIWDSAYVQTTILVYRERGTDAVAREQKSAEITASMKLNSWSSLCKKESVMTSPRINKSQLKHVNVGPSMFPFLYYPSKVLVGKSTYVSPPSSSTFSHSSRNINKNRVKEPKLNNSSYSGTQSKRDEEIHHNISKSSSLFTLPNPNYEVNKVTDNILTTADDKVTSTMIHLSSMKLANSAPQDMYTQMLVTCNNAATNIKFTPIVTNDSTLTAKSTQEVFYCGIDKGSDPITMNAPQRSISVMTSKGIIQEMVHKDTQVLLEPPIRKVSTAVMSQEQYKYAKPSVITDSTVPCRRLENRLITPKGTILSCAGTKMTSVSSVQIQTASVTSRISKMKNVVNAGTDGCQFSRSEKSTSCPVLKDHADAGLSVSNVVHNISFNGGSHLTQTSFCADVHPEYSSISMNTSRGMKSKSAGTGTSFEKQTENDIKFNKNNCHSQYSDPISRNSNEPSENSQYQARIGRSRLMSVRMLGDSVTEMATQVQPIFNNTEMNTALNQKLSASMFTSQYTFNKPLQATAKLAEGTGRTLTCHCAHVESDTETIDTSGHKTQSPVSPVLDEIACNTDAELKSLSRLMTRNGTGPKQETSKAAPNFVISSNLNAAKWIRGCAKESEKDVQSIIDLSETMVTESMDRASLVIAKDNKSISEMKMLSKDVINHQPAISCATAKAYNANPSVSIAKILPSKDYCRAQGSLLATNKQNCSNVIEQISDGTVTKDMKESIPKIRPNLRDTAPPSKNSTKPSSKFSIILKLDRIQQSTDTEAIPFKKRSASVFTSRHVIPRPSICCNNVCKNNIDCLFVYDRPRCVVHSYHADAKMQTDSEQDFDITKERSFRRKSSVSNRSIGLMTSLASHVPCRRKSGMIGEVLSPKVYKALYETTKLMSRAGSDSRTTKDSTIEMASNKTENEDSRAESIPNKKMSQMTSYMLFAPSHCFCARYLEAESMKHKSIQAVANQPQSFLCCPHCCTRVTELSHERDRDCTEDCLKSQLASSCRYYSNLLTIKLGQVKDNFKRHLAPPIEETFYETPIIPNIVFTEACTMKPSGRRDGNCQTKLFPHITDRPSSCVLFPALSLTDIRGRDKHDLKTVYYILTAIEGRVRRLKNNLRT